MWGFKRAKKTIIRAAIIGASLVVIGTVLSIITEETEGLPGTTRTTHPYIVPGLILVYIGIMTAVVPLNIFYWSVIIRTAKHFDLQTGALDQDGTAQAFGSCEDHAIDGHEDARNRPRKFCRRCGLKVPLDSAFCEYCGKKLAIESDSFEGGVVKVCSVCGATNAIGLKLCGRCGNALSEE